SLCPSVTLGRKSFREEFLLAPPGATKGLRKQRASLRRKATSGNLPKPGSPHRSHSQQQLRSLREKARARATLRALCGFQAALPLACGRGGDAFPARQLPEAQLPPKQNLAPPDLHRPRCTSREPCPLPRWRSTTDQAE